MEMHPPFRHIVVIGLVCYVLLATYRCHNNTDFTLLCPLVHSDILNGERFHSTDHTHLSLEPQTGSRTSSIPMMNNKLKNGLLVTSQSDPQSCISRLESHKYRKPSPHKPSSYLISKLLQYESLHQRCGAHTKPYNETIRKLQAEFNDEEYPEFEFADLNETCNYIIWKASGGLGNRMLSLASAFLYALLTNRVLLVDFATSSMANLFCEPFPSSTWLLPNNLQLLIENYSHEYDHSFQFMQRRRNTTETSSPVYVYVDLHSYTSNIKVLHCNDSQMILNEVPILILKSDVYYVPSLFMASPFQEELRNLFPQNEVFSLLGTYLFNPSNEAWQMITKFYDAYLANVNQRVGLQIRLFNNTQGNHATYMKQILSCVSSYNLLPQVKTNVTTTTSKSYKTVVLVASLHSVYAKYLEKRYSGDFNGHRVAVYQPSHEESQNSTNRQHNMKAWVDIYLLSMCDVIVTSAESTFGYVAQNLGGLMPWILYKPMAGLIPDPPCRRALSMEPCFHDAPNFDYETKKDIVNTTSRFPHIRTCEDRIKGAKLFPVGK